MITHAYISRFKSVAEAHLDLNPVNLLVGRNANGKSNVVDALYFVHDCISEDLDTAIVKRHGIESIRQWSKTKPYYITIELHVLNDEGRGRYKFVLSSGRGTYRVAEEEGEFTGPDRFARDDDAEPRTTTFKRTADGKVEMSTNPDNIGHHGTDFLLGPTELFSTSLAGPHFSILNLALRPLVEDLRSFISYSIYPNTLREPRVVSREDRLLADGSNLPSILRLIGSHKRSKDSLIESLRLIMPNLADVTTRSAGGYYVPVIQVKESSGEAHIFNMSQVSDGTLRVLGLLAAFYQPNAPGIIALEEPEQMIHPGVLPILADAAKEFVTDIGDPYRQVFITTHSPSLLDLFDPESIIWTKQHDGITKCGPITARQLGIIKKQLFTAGELFVNEGFSEN
ncbi:MAG: hypothetical protein E7812_02805 [Phenylobacterium sp.]|nr:MAG: hypothetical protein E7812_02805 [Phenylobacterium sp.]